MAPTRGSQNRPAPVSATILKRPRDADRLSAVESSGAVCLLAEYVGVANVPG